MQIYTIQTHYPTTMKLLRLMIGLLGLNPQAVLALRFFTRYLKDKKQYISAGGVVEESFPVLTDYGDSAGTARGHYFHQDLLVAQRIFLNKPVRHVDIGCRVDGLSLVSRRFVKLNCSISGH
jgi:hypothetical protein